MIDTPESYAAQEIEKIRTKGVVMSEGAKQGFSILLNYVSGFKKETESSIAELANEIREHRARFAIVEKSNAEILDMVNKINDKLDKKEKEQKEAEKKAAVFTFFEKILSTKFGKIFFILFLICFGVSIAYVIEHSTNVTQIVQTVK